jgi:hypothetical protein
VLSSDEHRLEEDAGVVKMTKMAVEKYTLAAGSLSSRSKAVTVAQTWLDNVEERLFTVVAMSYWIHAKVCT